MSAAEPLCHIVGVNHARLSKEEYLLIETELFVKICIELKEYFKSQYQNYFQVMKFNKETEEKVMEINFIRCIINDILTSEEYSLPGIAYYTNSPEEVIFEIASGRNPDPSSSLLRKIIELHRVVRPGLYKTLMEKMLKKT